MLGLLLTIEPGVRTQDDTRAIANLSGMLAFGDEIQ